MDPVEARAKQRKTQWDVTVITGISQTKISLIERGYVKPSALEKVLISQSLGFDVEDISWPVANPENTGKGNA